MKARKMLNLHHLAAFFIRLNELGKVSIKKIVVNFHLEKSLEIFDKNSADKIASKMVKEIKVAHFMLSKLKHNM